MFPGKKKLSSLHKYFFLNIYFRYGTCNTARK
jgi:hypothetical protein